MTTHATADPSEIARTQPDRTVHDPTGGQPRAWNDPDFFWLNEHLLVLPTKDGRLLATWTAEHIGDNIWRKRVACAHSADAGHTWSPVHYVDGTDIGRLPAAWQVPVVASGGRVYLLYTASDEGWYASGLRCAVSDDHGRSWSHPVDLPPFPKTAIDSPRSDQTPLWICCSGIHRDADGRVLLPFTRWARNLVVPAGDVAIRDLYCHIELMHLENVDDNPAPHDLRIRPLNEGRPVTAPHPAIPGASQAMEPYLVNLPDGRLFMTLRTNLGQAWYTVSADGGRQWRPAEPLRTRDGGDILLQPSSPCPIFSLARGDYLFLYNDNDGTRFDAPHVWDVANRRPAYLARGEFRPDAHQPLWWSAPRLVVDNDAVAWGPPNRGRLEAAAYGSLTEHDGQRVLWYPDRKGFLLGKLLPDAWLDEMRAPGP